jgi:hypothetical protein
VTYRAYRNNHIFIGIYWQRYGWVAPDMDISGLEDGPPGGRQAYGYVRIRHRKETNA